ELAEPADGGKAKLPEPDGFSGSPIWDTGFVASGCSKNWTPAQGRIVGIATCRPNESSSSVVATKAGKVREFLLENIRKDVAYHHWVERGKPANDEIDLTYASQFVQDLL